MVENEDIREAIAAAIEKIPEIGRVYREKVVHGSQDLVAPFFQYRLASAMYEAPSHLRGWQITLDPERPGEEVDGTTNEMYWVWTWNVEGFLEVPQKTETDPARSISERVLHGLANRIIETVRVQSNFDNIPGGQVLTRSGDIPGPFMREFNTVMLGTKICHAATVGFATLVITQESQ